MSEDYFVTNDNAVMNMPVIDDKGKQTKLSAPKVERRASNNRQSLDECLNINIYRKLLQKNSISSKDNELVPIVWVTLNSSVGKPTPIQLKALCDSGASSTIVKHNAVSKLRIRHDKSTTWNTAAGRMTTTGRCKIQFILVELSPLL